MRRIFTEDVVKELISSGTALGDLEKEWERLKRDREILRSVFPTGDNKVSDVLENDVTNEYIGDKY